jgi:hypothetical protein
MEHQIDAQNSLIHNESLESRPAKIAHVYLVMGTIH